MRLRNNPNAENELKQSKVVIQEFPFKLPKGAIVEMGMGKGEMITSLAKQNPSKKYIGIEKFATVANLASRRALSSEVDNLKIINKDISNLPEFLEGKAQVIWLTFSDPWPKKRHAKRRLTYKSFLELFDNLLEDDGVIKFKTDNDKLFEYSLESIKEYGFKVTNVTRDFHKETFAKDNIMTGYEEKWSSLGKNINYLEARKK